MERSERTRAVVPLTAERLRRLALRYLERYETTRAHLASVLRRHLYRASAAGLAEVGEADITRLVERLAAAGLVDDRRFAGQKAAGLERRGLAARAIDRKLAVAGVPEGLRQEALESLAPGPAGELARAAAYARRRRLGPFRPESERADRRLRDLAALARQGFAYETARQVVDAPDAATLHEMLAEL